MVLRPLAGRAVSPPVAGSGAPGPWRPPPATQGSEGVRRCLSLPAPPPLRTRQGAFLPDPHLLKACKTARPAWLPGFIVSRQGPCDHELPRDQSQFALGRELPLTEGEGGQLELIDFDAA